MTLSIVCLLGNVPQHQGCRRKYECKTPNNLTSPAGVYFIVFASISYSTEALPHQKAGRIFRERSDYLSHRCDKMVSSWKQQCINESVESGQEKEAEMRQRKSDNLPTWTVSGGKALFSYLWIRKLKIKTDNPCFSKSHSAWLEMLNRKQQTVRKIRQTAPACLRGLPGLCVMKIAITEVPSKIGLERSESCMNLAG